MKRVLVLVATLGALGLGGSLTVACSSNQEEAVPTRPPVPPGDRGNDAGLDAADDAAVDPECLGAAGCFKCEPVKSLEILNACTDSQCTPFDNAARLPLFKSGQPLPPVP